MTPEKLSVPHESKPWNPIIANVLYRAGIIEKWGMGTLNIVDWCKGNGNPKPHWQVRTQSVVTTFLPSRFFATGKTFQKRTISQDRPESRPKLRPESLEEKILDLLRRGPLSKTEIARHLGHDHISGGLKKNLMQLVNNERIELMISEKPNSRLQKYQINQAKRPESRPESLEEKILNLLRQGPLSKMEIACHLGHSHISGGLKKALIKLIESLRIYLTIPEKPNSRFQKYRISSHD